MNIEEIRDYCLSKPHATEDMPFGDDCVTFRVGGKIFAAISLEQRNLVLKCTPFEFRVMIGMYAFVGPAWHWPNYRWFQVNLVDIIDDLIIAHMIDRAYEIIYNKLPRKVRASLE